ncbi:hypothetical protein KAR91_62455 [Candidatus Pacearchaeota archaeon]|nr:hypothetical protein [Candidatus Pacearchaeota archaeon]
MTSEQSIKLLEGELSSGNRECIKCGKMKALNFENYYRKADGRGGYRSKCKICSNKHSKEWRANNKARRAATQKVWRTNNKSGRAVTRKAWRKNNPEYMSRLQTKSARKRKAAIIRHYSGGTNTCKQCPENDMDVLTVQHDGGGGNEHRRKVGGSGGTILYRWIIENNYPDGLSIYCANCNHKDSVIRMKESRAIPWSRHCLKRDRDKITTFNKYGGECYKCAEKDYNALMFDHKANDGAEDRAINGRLLYYRLAKKSIRNDLQLLCANCNLKKEILRREEEREGSRKRTLTN